MYLPLSEKEEYLGKQIVDAAFRVPKELGPGLLEKIYEECFCYELRKREIEIYRQVYLPIKYDNVTFDLGLKLDVYVENEIICELKAQEGFNSLWKAQLISHLKLTGNRLGFLINFNTPLIKDGITRIIV